ncbi:ATP-binding protein [bacterium]|nr:ATP-binding protein [bacterium]
MKRDIEKILEDWRREQRRRPLLVRGARQVGKSYTITKFGRMAFDDIIVINFEQNPEYMECFSTLNTTEIIENISVLCKKDVISGKTLLFLDEIQECPRAITSLRYFYEQMPQLHVIGAGSLMEFVLLSENFKMPVGRIQYLYMKPLSFGEFMDATGNYRLRKLLGTVKWDNTPLKTAVHKNLISLVKKYMVLGGMPSVVSEYLDSGSLNKCQRIQTSIIQTYRDDFGKYASKVKHKYLQKVFYAVPKMTGRKFKYSHVDPFIQSRDLKEAVEVLEHAGVLYRVKKTSGEGLPLEANANEKHFKVVFLDVGLMQNICGLDSEIILLEDLLNINAGALAEQFVAQELLAYQNSFQQPSLHYWNREARNSSAEIDYLIACGGLPIPVEVKSGKTGRLRSMHLYLEKYRGQVGVRISQLPFSCNLPIISVPIYAIERVRGIIKNCLL